MEVGRLVERSLARVGVGALILLLLCALLVLAPGSRASGAASKFIVTGFGDGAGSCGATNPAGVKRCTTLRAAIDLANLQTNDPTIVLAAGTYKLTRAAGGQLTIKEPMILQGKGPGGSGGTVIKQTSKHDRVLSIGTPANQMVQLTGLEVTGGHLVAPTGQSADGGGIYSTATLELERVLAAGNLAEGGGGSLPGGAGGNAEGGGIYLAPSAAHSVIDHSAINANVTKGGAGGAWPGGTGGNGGGGGGGGIESYAQPLNLNYSTVSGNTASGGNGGAGKTPGSGQDAAGGGIFAGADVTMIGSTVAANLVAAGAAGGGAPSLGGNGDGGGLLVETNLSVVNSTLFDNTAQGGTGSAGHRGFSGAGGIDRSGAPGQLVLASDTIYANHAGSAVNVFAIVPTFTVRDTIIAGGGKAGNCELSPPSQPIVDDGYNLEDDTFASCRFSSAKHDLVGVNPRLPSKLGSNGGPTQTLAPAPGSPVIHAGGECLDLLLMPPQPLLPDQRGKRRHDPCDIGAFEHQPPVNVKRPRLSGMVAVGQAVVCLRGRWSGDFLKFSYRWLRDGVAIPGARGRTYSPAPSDQNHRLACRVKASHYGSARATSKSMRVGP